MYLPHQREHLRLQQAPVALLQGDQINDHIQLIRTIFQRLFDFRRLGLDDRITEREPDDRRHPNARLPGKAHKRRRDASGCKTILSDLGTYFININMCGRGF